jgi:hypothetical protein
MRDHLRNERLDGFFTGHAPDGTPLRDGNHRHLAFAFDADRRRLLVIAPHAMEHRPLTGRERGPGLPSRLWSRGSAAAGTHCQRIRLLFSARLLGMDARQMG